MGTMKMQTAPKSSNRGRGKPILEKGYLPGIDSDMSRPMKNGVGRDASGKTIYAPGSPLAVAAPTLGSKAEMSAQHLKMNTYAANHGGNYEGWEKSGTQVQKGTTPNSGLGGGTLVAGMTPTPDNMGPGAKTNGLNDSFANNDYKYRA